MYSEYYNNCPGRIVLTRKSLHKSVATCFIFAWLLIFVFWYYLYMIAISVIFSSPLEIGIGGNEIGSGLSEFLAQLLRALTSGLCRCGLFKLNPAQTIHFYRCILPHTVSVYSLTLFTSSAHKPLAHGDGQNKVRWRLVKFFIHSRIPRISPSFIFISFPQINWRLLVSYGSFTICPLCIVKGLQVLFNCFVASELVLICVELRYLIHLTSWVCFPKNILYFWWYRFFIKLLS